MIVLLEELRNLEASDGHDKVYATYGMANKLSTQFKPPSLTADYSISVEKAYQSFAQDTLTHLPTLAVLSFAVGVGWQKPPILPSWCPDYRRSAPKLHQSSLLFWEHERSTQPRPRLFSASGERDRTSPVNSISDNVLSVTGKNMGTIAKTSSPLIPPGSAESGKSYPDLFLAFGREIDAVYTPTGEDRLVVLWRTMLYNTLTGLSLLNLAFDDMKFEAPAPAECADWFISWILISSSIVLKDLKEEDGPPFIHTIRRQNETFGGSSIALPSMTEIMKLSEKVKSGNVDYDEFKDAESSFREAIICCRNRKLIQTAEKHVGLSLVTAQLGDEVWLLQRAKVPFILRPPPVWRYYLVGEAYIHGIMFGEAVDGPGGRDNFIPVELV